MLYLTDLDYSAANGHNIAEVEIYGTGEIFIIFNIIIFIIFNIHNFQVIEIVSVKNDLHKFSTKFDMFLVCSRIFT